jgi:DNA-binding transcriptional ArsR family regulator
MITTMQTSQLAALCHAMGNPDRLTILRILCEPESIRTVDGLSLALWMPKSTGYNTVRRHLEILREQNLVYRVAKEGNLPYEWHVHPTAVENVVALLQAMLDSEGFGEESENGPTPE